MEACTEPCYKLHYRLYPTIHSSRNLKGHVIFKGANVRLSMWQKVKKKHFRRQTAPTRPKNGTIRRFEEASVHQREDPHKISSVMHLPRVLVTSRLCAREEATQSENLLKRRRMIRPISEICPSENERRPVIFMTTSSLK